MPYDKLVRPIFGNTDSKSLSLGQLFDLQDEKFWDSSILKSEQIPAVKVTYDKKATIDVLYKPLRSEFISYLADDVLTQLKAHSNLGLFETLTTDPRILSPSAETLLSIKFIDRKKVLQLSKIQTDDFNLNENLIGKVQYAVTEIEMGQWILASVTCKNNETEVISKLEVIRNFLELYFSPKSSLIDRPEIPSEASDFLFKPITSQTITTTNLSLFVPFKEFFEFLKAFWDKSYYYPISVTMTSLLNIGLLTYDDRLNTLQKTFEFHERLLCYLREFELAIDRLQEALGTPLSRFTTEILQLLVKKLIYFDKMKGKLKAISLLNDNQVTSLYEEILRSWNSHEIDTFLRNLEARYAITNSNFMIAWMGELLNLNPSNVKFCLIVGESEAQKTDFINFLLNFSHLQSPEEAVTYKLETFLPYSNKAERKTIIMKTKSSQTIVFLVISKLDYCLSSSEATNQLAVMLAGNKDLHAVILLFSDIKPLESFEKWIPLQLQKATNNFIYFNFYSKTPIKSQEWSRLAENLPTGSLYFLSQKILKQNFHQMSKDDLELGITNVQQILRKLSHSSAVQGIGEDVAKGNGRLILEACKGVMLKNEVFCNLMSSEAGGEVFVDALKLDEIQNVFISGVAKLCSFVSNNHFTDFFEATFHAEAEKSSIDTIKNTWISNKGSDPGSLQEIQAIFHDLINSQHLGTSIQRLLRGSASVDVISYDATTKYGAKFFNESLYLSWKDDVVFEKLKVV